MSIDKGRVLCFDTAGIESWRDVCWLIHIKIIALGLNREAICCRRHHAHELFFVCAGAIYVQILIIHAAED